MSTGDGTPREDPPDTPGRRCSGGRPRRPSPRRAGLEPEVLLAHAGPAREPPPKLGEKVLLRVLEYEARAARRRAAVARRRAVRRISVGLAAAAALILASGLPNFRQKIARPTARPARSKPLRRPVPREVPFPFGARPERGRPRSGVAARKLAPARVAGVARRLACGVLPRGLSGPART